MSEPKRIQRQRTKGWRMPENTVYVGRPGKFGNPFQASEGMTAQRRVDAYRKAVHCGGVWDDPDHEQWTPVPSPDQIRADLAGKNLACWCPLDQPCHADVLLEIANKEQP